MTIKSKAPLHLRHELKYAITRQEDILLAARLRKLFPHDKYADSHGSYRVSSIYFDTPRDRALRQKTDGVNRREKFRIRYYGEQANFLRLERKIKINGLCSKQSARLTPEQVQQILRGEYGFLLDGKEPLLVEFYTKLQGQLLRPKSVVCYDREAFVYAPGNARVTLDRNLRTSLYWADFLNADKLHFGVSDAMTVLEVKYDEYLPELVRMAIQLGNQRSTAYSKYVVCRKYE